METAPSHLGCTSTQSLWCWQTYHSESEARVIVDVTDAMITKAKASSFIRFSIYETVITSTRRRRIEIPILKIELTHNLRYIREMKFCVGAYAASPSANGWNEALETSYYKGLRAMPELGGLEIPFLGSLHPHNSGWFLDQLSPDWNSVLTPIPGVMNTLNQDPSFGLASTDEAGRSHAVDFMAKTLESVHLLNRHFKRSVVSAVEVHSAPTLGKPGISSSTEAFAKSLSQLRSWDWQGAHLLVEHCDAFQLTRPPAKGFLPLAWEIEAIQTSKGKTPLGVLINWGRSAIEGHSVFEPEIHLAQAKSAGVLSGLIFSGCTVGSESYGEWSDSHAPFKTSGSLLTLERASACVKIAEISALKVFGFKMQALPKSLGVEERLRFLQDNVEFLRRLV